MNSSRSHLDIALGSIEVFADDGRMDLAELERLLALALRDRVIDEDERRVLANIFRRAEEAGLSPETAERLAQVRREHSIPA